MAKYLEPQKAEGVSVIPIFQKVLETDRGGYSLSKTGLTEGEILPAGTAMTFDEKTRVAKKAKADGSDVKGLLYDSVKIVENAPVAIVVRGTVYKNRIPEASRAEAIIKALPLIRFSESF
ncbi:hypothetical protein SAMN05443429_10883 [Cruoricaptor ignavus]|uniref:Bacteriophage lambda head decoration protein D n=1 Tax=Cruoricaptor ignavus TaxID=1118202 RepID=A0A1M6G711_9FLAO|nr:hypothetical protein [Cruoricaptor ignavus]SHJ05756.1 hypothetical protein SAMN05443429_10883 [Cruoricaptor ignavus]